MQKLDNIIEIWKFFLLRNYFLGQKIYQCLIQYIAIVLIVFTIGHRAKGLHY